MKSCLSLSVVVLFISCSNDIAVISPGDPTTFVYSILESADSINYLRINKSFIAYDNALNYAQQSDSLYYKDIEVNVELIQNSTKSIIVKAYELIMPAKDSGLFAREPNVAYALHRTLKGFTKARLQIIIPQYQDTIVSETDIIKGGKFLIPGSWTTSNEISFYGGSCDFHWQTGTGSYHSFSLTFHYRDLYPQETVGRSFDYLIQSDLDQNGDRVFSLKLTDFLYTIKSRIPERADVIVRNFDSINFRVQSADKFLYDYANLFRSNPSEFAVINFTNIQNGSGIFASRATSYLTGIQLDVQTLDSLIHSPLTRHLKFVRY